MKIGDMVQSTRVEMGILLETETGVIIKGPYYRGAPLPHPELFGVSNEYYTVLWLNGHKTMSRKIDIEVINECK